MVAEEQNIFKININSETVQCMSDTVTKLFPADSKSGDSSGAEGPSSVRSSEDGSEGSGATGGGSSNYKERGEFPP